MKLYNPKLNILILEKYPQYQRSHVVHIDKTSFKNAHPDPQFQECIKSLTGLVPTNKIETQLKKYALELGIKINYEPVNSCKELAERYTHTKLFIGADGAHSIVRKEMFEERKSEKNLQYVIELKYEVKGKSRAFSVWSEAYDPLLKSNHLIIEHVGKEKENHNTPITLRLIINEKEFKKMEKATFKTPYNWTEEDKKKMPSALVQSIQVWLKERQEQLKDQVVPGSIKISALKLNTYSSEDVIIPTNNQVWTLVGDSAFGVPYFRSLNNGILCANELAKHANDFLQEKPVKYSRGYFWKTTQIVSPLEIYSLFVSRLANREQFIANIKKFLLESINIPLNMTRTALQVTNTEDRNNISIPGRMLTFSFVGIGISYLLHGAYKALTNNNENTQLKTRLN